MWNCIWVSGREVDGISGGAMQDSEGVCWNSLLTRASSFIFGDGALESSCWVSGNAFGSCLMDCSLSFFVLVSFLDLVIFDLLTPARFRR